MPRDADAVTVVLNFGMVDTTFDMAACFAFMTATMLTADFMLVVVSMKDAILPGLDLPSLVRVHTVVVEREDVRSVQDIYQWQHESSQAELYNEFDTECDVVLAQAGRHVALTNVGGLAAAVGDKDGQLYNVMGQDVQVNLWGPPPRLNVVLSGVLPYIGRIPNLGDVFLDSHRPGWMVDDVAGQTAIAQVVPRSQHEVRQAMHLRNELGELGQHILCWPLDEGELESLPKKHQALCCVADLDQLLLMYICIHSGQGQRLLDMSAVLPRERPLLLGERLRRLNEKGLIHGATPGQGLDRGVLLHDVLQLTSRGSDVVRMFLDRTLESVHSACLVAQWSSLPKTPAVADAIFSLATVLETQNYSTTLDSVIILVKPEYTELGLDEPVAGVAEPLYRRGPVWLAILLWHRMRVDRTWRPKDHRTLTLMNFHEPRAHAVSKGRITFDRIMSFAWDDVWSGLARYRDADLIPEARGDLRLTKPELHLVEKAIVRAFLHNLAWVNMKTREPFAYDLTSQRALQSPGDSGLNQLCVEECWQLAKDEKGADVAGFFGFYTCLARDGDGSSQDPYTWVPTDLTYVSSKAVKEVLAEVAPMDPKQDLISRLHTGPVEPGVDSRTSVSPPRPTAVVRVE